MNDEPERRPHCDLDRHRKTAKSTRQLAWDLLKQTRNAPYVALRYGFDIETMEKALEKIPPDDDRPRERSVTADGIRSQLRHASTLLDPIAKGREPGQDDE